MVSIFFKILGSIGILLFGMKLMSDGIQKSAGESLHKVLGFMTSNRFFAVLTGIFVTVVIQSSSATTVMVVSFVNAGLLTLTQSIGVIFGANIGTTVTAWIVALVGFKFKIGAIAIPLFGIGFLLSNIKRLKKQSLGEALMGFGLLFMGLGFLSDAIPNPSPESIELVAQFSNSSFSTIVAVLAGISITILMHSSSAATAVIITMAHKGLLTWEFSAAMVLGSNIGTTIDAVIVSIGAKVNARRAALIHVLFNVVGSVVAIIFLHPLLSVVEFFIPSGSGDIATQLATLHTVFNVGCSLLFLPFVTQLATLTKKLIKPKKDEVPDVYKLDFITSGIRENSEAYIMTAEKEIIDMTKVASTMYQYIQSGFEKRDETFIATIDKLTELEDFADQMKEQLSRYLINCEQLALSDKQKANIPVMLHIVDEIENITDDTYKTAFLLKRSIEKKMLFSEEDTDQLIPYSSLVSDFISFIETHINTRVSDEDIIQAQAYEDKIDAFRKSLKKVALKRLESGANVKAELLYIDIVKTLEKIGDSLFVIAGNLFQLK
ncbi:MAG: Na/Pi cotransporter family protein [Treponemataceae bacterium]